MPRYFVSKLGGQLLGCSVFCGANDRKAGLKFNRKSRGARPHSGPRLSFLARLSWAFVFFFRYEPRLSRSKFRRRPITELGRTVRRIEPHFTVLGFGSKSIWE